MSQLYLSDYSDVLIEDIVFDGDSKQKIEQFLKEYELFELLNQYDLPVANKLLLHGHSGCGKTMTAKAIAHRLDKKLYIVNLGNIVSSKLGETSLNITSLFNKVKYQNDILFFDEFDSLGKMRDLEIHDNGEMKRVVNTLLQLIDYLPKDSILIAATNQLNLLDHALRRRFNLTIEYQLPSKEVLDHYYDQLLAKYPKEYQKIERSYGISFAEAQNLVFNQVKANIINLHQSE